MNVQHMKLGKKPYRFDQRTLKLSKYIKALPPPPAQAGYIDKVRCWPMLLNSSLADCVVAAAGHMIQQWSTYAGKPFTPSDGDVLRAYMAVSGYNPNDPSSDQGAVILDMLNYWRKTGLGGHKIAAFVSVDPANTNEIKQAIHLFGNCYAGIGLPVTAQDPTPGVNGLPVWSMPSGGPTGDGEPYSWGGHCLAGTTEIPLLNGSSVRIQDLVGHDQAWVYSCTEGGRLVPGRAHSFRRTSASAEMFRIILDSGESEYATSDHRFMMRDGSYRKACELAAGDSMMPLYRRLSSSESYPGYEECFVPASGQWRLTHRIVGGQLKKLHRGLVVHHVNHNKRNNDPANLEVMTWQDHTDHHATQPVMNGLTDYAKSERGRMKSAELMSAMWADPAWKAKTLAQNKINLEIANARQDADGTRGTYQRSPEEIERLRLMMGEVAPLSWTPDVVARRTQTYRDRFLNDPEFAEAVRDRARRNIALAQGLPVTEAQRRARSANGHKTALAINARKMAERTAVVNHKVVAIERAGAGEVFDMAVDDHHNFALSSGIFAHNCVPLVGYGADQRGNKGSEVITWGQIYDMTWGFAGLYLDEAWAVVSPDWIAADGVSPSGFALSELLNDISQIR